MSEPQEVAAQVNKEKSAKDILKEVFGYDDFRTGQDDVIDAAMQGQDT